MSSSRLVEGGGGGGVQLLTQTLVFAYRKAEIMDRVLIEKKVLIIF